jgi:general stress protein 26
VTVNRSSGSDMNANDDKRGDAHSVDQLLSIAREIVANVKNCWLVTVARSGEANARIVAPTPGADGDTEWTTWVLTSAGSRKVDEINRDDRVTLGYQHDPDSAYVALAGRGSIVADRSEISQRWNSSWNRVFQAGGADADAVFIKVVVDRIELFSLAREVAPAPFCKRCEVLVRDPSGGWSRA